MNRRRIGRLRAALMFPTLAIALAACVASGGCVRHGRGEPGDAGPTATASATLEARVRDARTGAPISRCSVVGRRTAGRIEEVMPSGDHVAADGVHRFEVPPMVGRVRLSADGYGETWTDEVRLAAGETTAVEVPLVPLSRLVVEVVERDGTRVRSGTLRLYGRDLDATLIVRDGVADGPVDADEVLVVVDPEFMPGFAPREQRVALRPGERTDARLVVERR